MVLTQSQLLQQQKEKYLKKIADAKAKREARYGTNPSRTVRRSRVYKLYTADIRGSNNALKEIAKAKQSKAQYDLTALQKYIKDTAYYTGRKQTRKVLTRDLTQNQRITSVKVEPVSKKINVTVNKKVYSRPVKNVEQLKVVTRQITPVKIATYNDFKKYSKPGSNLDNQKNNITLKNKPVVLPTAEAQQLNLLKNAPKDVAVGVYEVGKETVIFAKDIIKGSFNYGRNMVKRAENGEALPLINDINKIATGTVSAATFITKNPTASVAIVGTAVAAGGKQYEKAFFNNPVKTLTKTAIYLAPGTLIKGATKTIKISSGSIKSINQARRLSTLSKKVNVAKQGALTVAQTKKLDKSLIAASKISNVVKREAKVKNALTAILKQRKFKPVKGASIEKLSSQVKASKVAPIKIIPKTVKKVTPKILKPKTINVNKLTKAQVKKVKVSVGQKVKITPKKTIPKKKIQRIQLTNKGLKKVTKKEFTKLTPKKPVGRPKKPLKIEKKVKTINIEQASKQQLKRELDIKGVVKRGDTTYIDLNAVKRIENTKVTPKIVSKKGLMSNKKAQVQFQINIEKHIQKTSKTIKKVIKTAPRADKVKVLNNLKKVKVIVNSANAARIIKAAGLAKVINEQIRILDNNIKRGTIPKSVPIKATGTDIIREPIKKQGKVTEVIKTPVKDTPVDFGTSSSSKTIYKTPTKPKKTPTKPYTTKTIKIKIPSFNRGVTISRQRNVYGIKYKLGKKIVKKNIEMPLNKAIKYAARLNKKEVIILKTGKKKVTDILRPQLNKFKVQIMKTQIKVIKL